MHSEKVDWRCFCVVCCVCLAKNSTSSKHGSLRNNRMLGLLQNRMAKWDDQLVVYADGKKCKEESKRH